MGLSNYICNDTIFFRKMFLHGPYEIADVASKLIHSNNGYFLQIYLSALSMFSSERARRLTVGQRKCRFYYESDLRHSPVYSFVLCRMECRATLAKKLCNCMPHFYRKRGKSESIITLLCINMCIKRLSLYSLNDIICTLAQRILPKCNKI